MQLFFVMWSLVPPIHFYGFSTLKVYFDATSFANVLEALTQSFIVRYSYVTFADGFAAFVSGCFCSTCLQFHPVDGPCRIFAD